MAMPGANVTMSVELMAPMALEEGLRFAIREGGRTVGAGRATNSRKQAGSAGRALLQARRWSLRNGRRGGGPRPSA